jgi:ornithine cyclodeaminase/alanine dehydrogenase-like protein (mu-crystallin family)
MLVLSHADLVNLLSLHQIIDAVEEAMIAYEKGQASVLKRMHMDHGANTFLCMPSLEQNYFGTKLVSVVPENKNRDLPVTNGAMLLNETSTGLPLALLNASKLTALRTGALGAIGIKYLTPSNESSFGLIGCGVQGLHQAIFTCAVRKISKMYFLDRSKEKSETLLSLMKLHHPDVEVEACHTTDELLRKTNIIIAATTSAVPVLPNDPTLLKGKHFISIGSYKPFMQELPDSVYQLAGELAIDSEFARQEVGDIINPKEKGLLKEEDIFTIGKIINGDRSVDVNGTTVYKSAGMALFDLFVAKRMYEQAMKDKKGTSVSW